MGIDLEKLRLTEEYVIVIETEIPDVYEVLVPPYNSGDTYDPYTHKGAKVLIDSRAYRMSLETLQYPLLNSNLLRKQKTAIAIEVIYVMGVINE